MLLLSPAFCFANTKGGEKAEKKIQKEFAIQSNGKLMIDNRFGAIEVAIGESNRIKFDITITTEAGNLKKAQEALGRIDVIFNEGPNRVEAKTEVESTSNWMPWSSTGNIEMRIDYQVYVPADIFLDLTNKYGEIYLERTDRDAQIHIGYGEIRLGDINANLILNMQYSDGALSQIKGGKLDIQYSDLEMEDSQTLTVDIKYGSLGMGSATRLELESAFSNCEGIDVDEVSYTGKYDDLQFDRVKSITANTGYSGIGLSGLDQSGEFEMQYGELDIEGIGRNLSRLNINASFTTVELGFSDNASATIDAVVNYCEVEHSGITIKEKIEQGGKTTLKAVKGSGGGNVMIRMNYGELIIE
jgi:hypothetical protein